MMCYIVCCQSPEVLCESCLHLWRQHFYDFSSFYRHLVSNSFYTIKELKKMQSCDWGSMVEKEEKKEERKHRIQKRIESGQLEYMKSREKETDPEVLERRQKQIDYGRSTPEYANYCRQVPVRSKDDPHTPDKNRRCSRRGWDSQVRLWRRQLHLWDPVLCGDNSKPDSNTSEIGSEEDWTDDLMDLDTETKYENI